MRRIPVDISIRPSRSLSPAPIEAGLLFDPDIRFFETANPGHREGDMLVCLAPLTAGNLLGAIARRWRLTARASPTRR